MSMLTRKTLGKTMAFFAVLLLSAFCYAEGQRVVCHYSEIRGEVGKPLVKANGDHYFDVDWFDFDTAPVQGRGDGEYQGMWGAFPGLSIKSYKSDVDEDPSDRDAKDSPEWYHPKGTWYDSGWSVYTGPYHPIVATPTKVGVYNFSMKFKWPDKYTESIKIRFIITSENTNLLDVDYDSDAGTVTGAGVYAANKRVTLKATPKKGYAFAGWYYDEDYTEPCDDQGVDYRTATITYTMPDEETELFARFVTAQEDAGKLTLLLDGDPLAGQTLTINNSYKMGALAVDSYSLPSVKVSGLPKGLAFNAKTMQVTGYLTTPGTYPVTVTLSNTSKKNKAEKFTIVVTNLDTPYITPSWSGDASSTASVIAGVTLANQARALSVTVDSDWTLKKVSGLPAGLSFNAKTGEITGKATKIGTYTVTFMATMTNRYGSWYTIATRTIKVEGRKIVLASIGEAAGDKTLSGAGEYVVGTKVALKAVPQSGYVFAGWYLDEAGSEPCTDLGVDYRTASASYPMPNRDVALFARFVLASEDEKALTANLDGEWKEIDGTVAAWHLDVESITLPTVKISGLPKGLTFNAKTLTISGCPTTPGLYNVTVKLSNTSTKNKVEKFRIYVKDLTSDKIHGLCDADTGYVYRPGVRDNGTELTEAVKADEGYSLRVSGLPAGLKFNSKTGKITGTATKPGYYTVTFTATKKGAATETSTRQIEVEALEMGAVGTFNGFLRVSEAGESCGTFTLTATSLGKITAKVVNAKGTYSFSGIWDSCEPTDAMEGTGGTPNVLYKSSLRSSNGATLDIALDLSKAWNKPTLTGTFNGSMFVYAYENLLSEKRYLKPTLGEDGKTWNLTVPESASDATLTLMPKGDGTATISGKIGIYAVSASSALLLGEMSEGLLSADFVSFVKVGNVKKPLVIKCALDMNRRTFGGDAGTAKILE